MSARDELATLIESGYAGDDSDCPYEHAPSIADAILAAGYTKPRTITTLEELAALPTDSVIRSGRYTLERQTTGWAMAALTENFIALPNWLPATVLYEPAP